MNPEQILFAAAIVFGGTLALALLVRTLDVVLPDRFVRERHDMALAALLLVPLIFALTFLPGTVTDGGNSAPIVLDTQLAIITETRSPIADVERNFASNAAPQTAPTVSIPWVLVALTVWLTGTLLSLGLLATRLVRLGGLRRTARPVELPTSLQLSRPLQVFEHDDIGSPMLIGYLKPCILVPTGFAFDTAARPVLEHEVAHAARGDSWITLGLHVLFAAFWWNLPMRLITPFYYAARESLCDTRAAIITGTPEVLAQALVDTAVKAYARTSPVLAAAAHGMDLKARVRRLMAPKAAEERAPVATLAFILPVLAASAVFATPALGTAQPAEYDQVDRSDRNEDEAMYKAARRGDLTTLQALVAAGEDPSAALPGDGTPLMGAIRGEEDRVFEALIAMGVDVNRISQGDGTALIAAVRQERADYVETLLSEGADPNVGVEGDGSALISAAMGGHLDIIDLLLAAGADPNFAQPRDGNPLIGAALHGELAAAERLIAAGADPNGYVYRDETPLINAAQQGELEMAKLLVAAGADVSLTVETPHTDPGGPFRSPLSEAERNGHDDVARWLKEMGATHNPAE